jgi:hypothetical protein
LSYRPVGEDWPGQRTPYSQITHSNFKSRWTQTIALLERELRAVGADGVVIQVDARERDFRLDGDLRADAKPDSARIIISFESKYGPLRYFCDRFWDWRDNVRAIALGLEALRKVDRYGITNKGEQYTGWKALPVGGTSLEQAREFVSEWGGGSIPEMLKRTHPDHGGTPELLRRALEARKTLETVPR